MNPHARLPWSPLAMGRSLWHHRELIARMARRDVAARYRGTVGGLLWAVITPIVMLAVYTFVFSVVFQAKWGTLEQSRTQFALILYAGLLMHGLLAEVLNGAPGLIPAHGNYVKKVVFPLEVLPVVSLCTALFQWCIGLVVLLVACALLNGGIPATAPLIVLVVVPLLLMVLALGWLASALGVYLRDLGQVMVVITTILLFMSPVFFPLTAIPQEYRLFMQANPLTFIIEQGRAVLIWGQAPDWAGLLAYTGVALVLAWLGFAGFQATRKGFADVL
ncbi:sugar ABC transporter permease [Comamonas serinivorans]|uniref:Transport permease protein n=1 Tax=Comamonas serinivorans TaxID=1082851 RepID=A0A1Y0ETN3_9BURK|nr:ABC transporter permease [Comamonas serinivorans]ARU06963.1 sugar ABC transporter permease [Comamonas serinivorans]